MATAIERTSEESRAIVLALRVRLQAAAARRDDRINEHVSQHWISWRSRKGNRGSTSPRTSASVPPSIATGPTGWVRSCEAGATDPRLGLVSHADRTEVTPSGRIRRSPRLPVIRARPSAERSGTSPDETTSSDFLGESPLQELVLRQVRKRRWPVTRQIRGESPVSPGKEEAAAGDNGPEHEVPVEERITAEREPVDAPRDARHRWKSNDDFGNDCGHGEGGHEP